MPTILTRVLDAILPVHDLTLPPPVKIPRHFMTAEAIRTINEIGAIRMGQRRDRREFTRKLLANLERNFGDQSW